MRAIPNGLGLDVAEVKYTAKVQAALTHNTDKAIQNVMALSVLLHYFAYQKGKKQEASAFIKEHVPGSRSQDWVGPVEKRGNMCVKAAMTALRRNSTLS
jgi:hypothetical protein